MENLKKIATVLFIILSTPVLSQNYTDTDQAGFDTFVQFKIDPKETTIDGSPYYAKEWKEGAIKFSNEQTFKVEAINYNIYMGIPTYRRDGRLYSTAKHLEVEQFTIGTDVFGFFEKNKSKTKAIFQILSTGPKIKLLKKYECSLVKGQEPKGYIEGTNDSYNIKSDYYVKRSAEPAFKIKDKKREILELLADKEVEIEKFLKKNSLNVKDEADLIAVFDYYATL